MKKILLTAILFCTVALGYSQKSYEVSFIDLPAKMAQQPRPVLIKMYTGWCAVCRLQDRQIEKDSNLQRLLADKVYYVVFDAESRAPIVFNGKKYLFVPQGTGGIHALAAELSEAKSYPAWVLLSPVYTAEAHHNGILKSSELTQILTKL